MSAFVIAAVGGKHTGFSGKYPVFQTFGKQLGRVFSVIKKRIPHAEDHIVSDKIRIDLRQSRFSVDLKSGSMNI